MNVHCNGLVLATGPGLRRRARTWRGREILGATCCCAAISFHCATQPTVRATANSTVNMLTGTCEKAHARHASHPFLHLCQ